ncbi:sec-independent protein translocase protein TatC [Halopenitus malekzadehii]|uniref:Sec-independent protein translocase protein TatC n=1 Tax=Halopenitus malekzadehii TaxID=1267564 RepID=A0A1H6HRK9_9EURY|nr:twin-arginine translocase subunit TatC [Halopenitus malekzadehii]SEH36814.1 sec-independent protein translocase protein TatC [Halopenitus malekzadehii]
MASALDDDTQETLTDGWESTKVVLRSIQKDLQKVFIVYLIGFLATFYALRIYVWDWLKGITAANMPADVEAELEIIAQTPFEVILLQAKIGLIVGAVFALPVLIYFARDGLRRRGMWPQAPIPRWKLASIGLLAAVLFLAGVSYGVFVFFPVMFSFLAAFGLEAGFNPSYSIVMWTEFIVFLTISFGLAGQMPLVITGLSYSGIVPYETFRDKWRHAVVGIFFFGAMFSPPDPFTQIMWAIPLTTLYGFSLYLAKVVVTAKRSSDRIDPFSSARTHWNLVLGAGVLGGGLVYAYYTYGGLQATNALLQWVGSDWRVVPPGSSLGINASTALAIYATGVAILFVVLAVLAAIYRDLDADATGTPGGAAVDAAAADATNGDPSAIDLSALDAGGVRAAPEAAFTALSEEEALAIASDAMEDDDPEAAQAILDRFDEATAAMDEESEAVESDTADDGMDESDATDSATADVAEATDSAGAADSDGGLFGGITDRASRASTTFLDDFADDADEEDIGGYYTDLKFIVGSLRSRSFRLVGWFVAVMGAVFTWLYLGGLGGVRADFLDRLPERFDAGEFSVITLHPVEALVFMVKFSVLIGLLAVIPLVAYYAWPALRERGFVRGHERHVFIWTGALGGGIVGGFALGYFLIAPGLISYLVADALGARMVITYRINDFFWLIIFTTLGIGLLADVPVLMVLLNSVGVPYDAFRNRWREATIAAMTFAAVLTPADIVTMILVTVPVLAAYWVGVGILFVVTLGGRRNLAPPARILEATDRFDLDTSE